MEKKKRKQERIGLVIVNTGNGKGKTTAALGTALRAVGSGFKVFMVQFIKGPWKAGEHDIAEKLKPNFEIRRMENRRLAYFLHGGIKMRPCMSNSE